jgi:ketosteroid isomerase-like protein
MTVPERSPKDIVAALMRAQADGDFSSMRELLAEDYIEDYPQSGERIHGADAALDVRQRFPGLPDARIDADVKISVGGEDRWALSPNFTAIRVTADGDTVTVAARAAYPDGPWYVIAFIRVAAGKVAQTTMFFAPMFDPPEGRRDLVQRMPDEQR